MTMKKGILALIVISVVLYAFISYSKPGKQIKNAVTTIVVSESLVNEDSLTVYSRIKTPEGYTRVVPNKITFSEYIHTYKLKPAGTPIINYDSTSYFYQSGHIGVLDVPVPSNGLQQCADALIRLRAEYLWDTNRKVEIGFKFTSGHYCSWDRYSQGYRPKIDGNKVTFHKTATSSTSKASFYKYLNLIYTYAGTYSLSQELTKVNSISDLKVGDLLIYPGFPGHVMMIASIVENENGQRLFAFFQGNTPAQSVHMIKNATDTSISPWYNLDGKTSLETPLYTFESFKFVRFK